MKQISQMQLNRHIDLVKWEHCEKVKKFNLLTVHSLLVDSNPKFIELKQIIEDYNHETQSTVGRVHLKQKFVEKLYGMLCELVRIPIYENMIEYLNNVYKWAQNDSSNTDDTTTTHGGSSKNRPTTASTRTRPFSAYSRPFSGRPGSAHPVNAAKIKKHTEQLQIHEKMKRQKTNIDYDRLKPGDKQFYTGFRTLHEQLQHPKKRLKDYQRKVFYDEESDSDVEILEIKINEKLPEIPLAQQKFLENQLEALAQGEDVQNQRELAVELGPDGLPIEQNPAQNIGDEGIVDDIPIQGEQDAPAEIEEEVEVIDKLKPRIKAYIELKDQTKGHQKEYFEGEQIYNQNRQLKERKIDEDIDFAEMQAKWANQKSRIKTELKRRAESARMMTQKIGIVAKKQKKQEIEDPNTIDFEGVNPIAVNTKGNRQIQEFIASTKKNRDEVIKTAFLTGKLELKTQSKPNTFVTERINKIQSLTNPAQKPKKRTFEQILRQAEQKVKLEADQEILDVKEAFAKNKISYGANRIAKSITFYEKQLPEEPFIGHITGMNLIKNPFIKVAKKKKKKKKK